MFWRRFPVDLVELSFCALDILGKGLMKEHRLNYIQREQNSNLPLPMDTQSSTLKAMSRSTQKQSSNLPIQLGTFEKKALISVKRLTKEINSRSHYTTTGETTNRSFSLPKHCPSEENRSSKSRVLRKLKTEAIIQEPKCVDNLKQQLFDRSVSQSGWKLLTSVQHKLIRDMGKTKEQKQNPIIVKKPPLQSLDSSLQKSPNIKFNDLFCIKRARQLRNSLNQSVHRQKTDQVVKGIVFKEKKMSQKIKQRLRVIESRPLTFQKQIKMKGLWIKELSSLHNLVSFSSQEEGWQTFIEKEG